MNLRVYNKFMIKEFWIFYKRFMWHPGLIPKFDTKFALFKNDVATQIKASLSDLSVFGAKFKKRSNRKGLK